MQSATTHSRYTGELESIDLVLYNNSEASPKHQEEISRHENSTTQDNGRSADEPKRRSVQVAPDEETKRLWKRCNALLRFEQQLTKPYIFSACIHLCVLVSVTISTANLATEKHNFQVFWIDMQRGYYSLLLKDYSPDAEQKHVYSSQVQFVSSKKQVVDHLKYAFSRFNNANDTALAMIKLATNRDGNFINPNLCVSRRPSMVNYDEEYVEVISINCKAIMDERDIDEVLNHSINSKLFFNSIAVISMLFYFQHVYVINGIRPTCIYITADYKIENDFQQYLWPVRIIAQGRLSSCDNDTEQHFQPTIDIPYFVTIGALTGLFSTTSFVFQFIRLMMFFKLGKDVRRFAGKKNLNKSLWSWFCCWRSTNNQTYPYIPLQAYIIFFPLIHILDIIFLLVSITGITLQFTLLRTATTTDEFIQRSSYVALTLGLCSIYFWCSSFRLFNHSKSAVVAIRSLLNSKAAKGIIGAIIIGSFAYIGIVLFAWIVLGLFHPNFSSFRLSAESFYSLLFGDEVITVFDSILPEEVQYYVFVSTRIIVPLYGMIFPILLLSVVIAIVSVAAEQKYLVSVEQQSGAPTVDTYEMTSYGQTFNWRILLHWATAFDQPTAFPGTQNITMQRLQENCDVDQFYQPQLAENRRSLQTIPLNQVDTTPTPASGDYTDDDETSSDGKDIPTKCACALVIMNDHCKDKETDIN